MKNTTAASTTHDKRENDSMNVTRRYSFRREVSYTSLYVFSKYIKDGSTSAPSIGTATEYALDFVKPIMNRIDWNALAAISPDKLSIPEFIKCGARFYTSVTMSEEKDTALSSLCLIIGDDFKKLKKRAPYRNFVLAMALRAVIANDLEILPYKNNQSNQDKTTDK